METKQKRKSKNKNDDEKLLITKQATNARKSRTMTAVTGNDHLYSDRRCVRLALPQQPTSSLRCSSSILRLSSGEDRTSMRLSVDRSHSVKTTTTTTTTDPLENGAQLSDDQTQLHQTSSDTKGD